MRGERRHVEGVLGEAQRILERLAADVLELCESEADREAHLAGRAPAARPHEAPRARAARELAVDEARRALGYLGSGEVRLGAAHVAAASAWCVGAQRSEADYARAHAAVARGEGLAPLRTDLRAAWSQLGLLCPTLAEDAARHLARLGTDPRPEWRRAAAEALPGVEAA